MTVKKIPFLCVSYLRNVTLIWSIDAWKMWFNLVHWCMYSSRHGLLLGNAFSKTKYLCCTCFWTTISKIILIYVTFVTYYQNCFPNAETMAVEKHVIQPRMNLCGLCKLMLSSFFFLLWMIFSSNLMQGLYVIRWKLESLCFSILFFIWIRLFCHIFRTIYCRFNWIQAC